nr:nuclear transcription factor Y subunit beta-like [Crassostrea gigas]
MKSQPSYYYLRNREKPGDTILHQQQLESHSEDPLDINQQQREPEIHFENQQSHSIEQPLNQQHQMSDNQQTNQILEDNNPTEQQSTQQQPTEQQSIQQQPTEQQSIQQNNKVPNNNQQNNKVSNNNQQNQPNIIKMATGVKLKKFDGSENVFIWLSNFENWQKFHNESDAQALLAIGCNFEGQAATWFHSFTDQQKSSMPQFKQCLKDRFAPNEATFSLIGIKQDISENTDAYLARAEKIALGHNLPELYKTQEKDNPKTAGSHQSSNRGNVPNNNSGSNQFRNYGNDPNNNNGSSTHINLPSNNGNKPPEPT